VTADPPATAPSERSAARERFGPYALVLTVGLLVAAGAAIGADRDPLAWALPALVLTGLALVVITLMDGRPEERRLDRAARDLGLRHERARTLPPVTPVLAAMKEPRTVQTLEGDLDVAAPRVRLAQIKVGSVPLAVALTDLDGRDQALEDPHGVLEAAAIAAPPAPADPPTAAWVADHPLRIGYATGDDALVVFCPVRRGEDAPFRGLLDATRELHARLTGRA
jgi:hypothetical protein